jgi:hypothetical protein
MLQLILEFLSALVDQSILENQKFQLFPQNQLSQQHQIAP